MDTQAWRRPHTGPRCRHTELRQLCIHFTQWKTLDIYRIYTYVYICTYIYIYIRAPLVGGICDLSHIHMCTYIYRCIYTYMYKYREIYITLAKGTSFSTDGILFWILFGWAKAQLSPLMYITSINVHSGCEEFILFVYEDSVLQPWESSRRRRVKSYRITSCNPLTES